MDWQFHQTARAKQIATELRVTDLTQARDGSMVGNNVLKWELEEQMKNSKNQKIWTANYLDSVTTSLLPLGYCQIKPLLHPCWLV